MRPYALLLLLLSFPAQAANLAAHHAVYALTLDPQKAEGVLAATGTMNYEVVDRCGSWTTSQHLVIDMTNKDGQDVHLVSDYATQESKDGLHLDFHSKQMTDRQVTQLVDGSAALDRPGGPGHADFTNPQNTKVLLPMKTLFPMAHTAAIIDAATKGARFLSVPLFDGTGTDGAQDTFVTIESWKPASPQAFKPLSDLPYGRVHIAFFDRTTDAETPDYEIGMTYYANGVADGMVMDFGDFSMDGALTQLELRPSPHC